MQSSQAWGKNVRILFYCQTWGRKYWPTFFLISQVRESQLWWPHAYVEEQELSWCHHRPVAQSTLCISLISHNAPFCVHVCTFLLQNGALWDIYLMHRGCNYDNIWCHQWHHVNVPNSKSKHCSPNLSSFQTKRFLKLFLLHLCPM